MSQSLHRDALPTLWTYFGLYFCGFLIEFHGLSHFSFQKHLRFDLTIHYQGLFLWPAFFCKCVWSDSRALAASYYPLIPVTEHISAITADERISQLKSGSKLCCLLPRCWLSACWQRCCQWVKMCVCMCVCCICAHMPACLQDCVTAQKNRRMQNRLETAGFSCVMVQWQTHWSPSVSHSSL